MDIKKTHKKVRVYMALPRTLTNALDAQAEREGEATRAAVIRRACVEYLRMTEQNAQQEAA